MVKVAHEGGFFIAVALVSKHVRVQIVNHPVLRDRHVGCERFAVDDNDAILAKPSVAAAVINERRDEELRVAMALQIMIEFARVVQLCESMSPCEFTGRTMLGQFKAATCSIDSSLDNLCALLEIQSRFEARRALTASRLKLAMLAGAFT